MSLDFTTRASGSDHKDDGVLSGANRQPVSAVRKRREQRPCEGGRGGGGGGWLSMKSESVAAGGWIQMVGSDIFFKYAAIPTEVRCCFGMVTVCLWVDVCFCASEHGKCRLNTEINPLK